MLHYPKIPGSRNTPNDRCLAFEKYDGTNLHWDWDRDFGWHAFGTRRDMFNLTPPGIEQFVHDHAQLRECVEVFRATLADPIEQVLRDNRAYRDATAVKVFTEFVGPNSFAGLHRKEDPNELVFFDLEVEPMCIVGPWQFVAHFGHVRVARVVYQGRLTGKFAEDVRTGKFDVQEGVVCKGGSGGADLWMAKIKTYAYLEKLKMAFGEKWEDYWE